MPCYCSQRKCCHATKNSQASLFLHAIKQPTQRFLLICFRIAALCVIKIKNWCLRGSRDGKVGNYDEEIKPFLARLSYSNKPWDEMQISCVVTIRWQSLSNVITNSLCIVQSTWHAFETNWLKIIGQLPRLKSKPHVRRFMCAPAKFYHCSTVLAPLQRQLNDTGAIFTRFKYFQRNRASVKHLARKAI